MTTTLTYTGSLVVSECYACGISFGIPTGLNKHALEDHRVSFWCPLGHQQSYIGETDAEKERRLRKWADDRAAAERARADGAEASLRATKGHVTRLRKRVIEGECPFCGQHLRDLARHVGRVHPTETPELDPVP
jgi:hypothetical protein